MKDLSSISPIIDNIGPFNEVPQEYNSQDSYNSLLNSKILIIGSGGLGCEILKNLSLTGFKNIHIIDMDTIDLSNLNRQFLFRSEDIGKSKSEIAVKFIKNILDDDTTLEIVPHFKKIQDMDLEFYKQFQLVISGLDSIEARRWINSILFNLAESENLIIPLIDGGTEGFRGQSRVIIPTFTSCFECSLDLLNVKTTYPVCTIANTPRLPEHCIEWAHQLEWTRQFPNTKFDADDPDQVDWMFNTALKRSKEFGIEGVTKSLTLGVVKNIIPAIASTNAIIAASCCNEAFKYITSTNPMLNNYMMYSGDDSIFTYTYSYTKKTNCSVCGNIAKNIVVQNWWTLQQFIHEIKSKQDIQLINPSLTTSSKLLYMSSPQELQISTKSNLSKKMRDLVSVGEEIVITDLNLPISLKFIIQFEGSYEDPEFS
ncbi:uba3 [Candida pseudojiufengensis]|uniref:uba3 n=1 Tax=Candida pseudojiufengensis TaxID=497109 RepID=UPI0022257C4D|nr:uba3 [Candida pseudojiufengensis]KAI5962938.1 uba3 [Candida pseudojiufengensis]